MIRRALAALVLIGGAVSSPALASDCSDAVRQYKDARDEVIYALNRYIRCLNDSDGQDDCSTEFRRLKNAQGDLESASSDVQSDC